MFRATDGNWMSDVGTITISIYPVNDIPTVVDLSINILEDSQTIIELLGNDVDEDSLSYSLITEPINGTISLFGNQLLYNPDPDFNGSEYLEYTASDTQFSASPGNINIQAEARKIQLRVSPPPPSKNMTWVWSPTRPDPPHFAGKTLSATSRRGAYPPMGLRGAKQYFGRNTSMPGEKAP